MRCMISEEAPSVTVTDPIKMKYTAGPGMGQDMTIYTFFFLHEDTNPPMSAAPEDRLQVGDVSMETIPPLADSLHPQSKQDPE